MHRDFHYYICYMACRAAGLPVEDSLDMGEYGEIIDEAFNENRDHYVESDREAYLWTPDQWKDGGKKKRIQRTVTKVAIGKMVQKGKKRGYWFNMSWTAFHFLPNLDRKKNWSEYREKYAIMKDSECSVGKPSNLELEQMLICYPNSTNAANFEAHMVKSFTTSDVDKYINDALDDGGATLKAFKTKVLGDADADIETTKFVNAILGVRGHVFVDLWAHQGFTGVRSPRVNDCDLSSLQVKLPSWKDYKHFKEDGDTYTGKGLKFKVWKNSPDSYNGHGNLLRYPDLPGYHYKYTRPYDSKEITRSNPLEYEKAYKRLYELMNLYALSRGLKESSSHPWRPEAMDADFFKKTLGKADKTTRNQNLIDMIKSQDGKEKPDPVKRLVAADADPDFAVIREAWKRKDNKLAYFSLAALIHIKWLEQQMTPYYGDINKWFQANQTYKHSDVGTPESNALEVLGGIGTLAEMAKKGLELEHD